MKIFFTSIAFSTLVATGNAAGNDFVPERLNTWFTCNPKSSEPRNVGNLYINYYSGMVFSDVPMMGTMSQIGPGNVIKATEFLDETARPSERGGYILGGVESGIAARSYRYRPTLEDLVATSVTFSGLVIVEEPVVTRYDCFSTSLPDSVKESMSFLREEVISEYVHDYQARHLATH